MNGTHGSLCFPKQPYLPKPTLVDDFRAKACTVLPALKVHPESKASLSWLTLTSSWIITGDRLECSPQVLWNGTHSAGLNQQGRTPSAFRMHRCLPRRMKTQLIPNARALRSAQVLKYFGYVSGIPCPNTPNLGFKRNAKFEGCGRASTLPVKSLGTAPHRRFSFCVS